jgi:hypothetical protein
MCQRDEHSEEKDTHVKPEILTDSDGLSDENPSLRKAVDGAEEGR